MISITRKEYDREFIQKGYEEFTEDQFRKWIDLNSEVLVKGEQGMLEDDLEKAEYEGFKEEIRSFTAVEVVEPSPISQFRIQKSIMYVRPKQVEWDEPELIKGENGEEIEKARSGKYKDTPLNRKLGRVGSPYGSKKGTENKKEEGGKPKIKTEFDLKEGQTHTFKFDGKTVSGTITEIGTRGYMNIRIGDKNFMTNREEFFNENYNPKSSNSTTDDKGKSEKKQEGSDEIKVGDLIPLGPGPRGNMVYGEVESVKDDTVKVRMSGGQTLDFSMAGALHYLKKDGAEPVIEKLKQSSSKPQSDDKGKSEKKQSETKRSIKELEDLHPSEMSFKEFERLRGSQGTYNGSDMERSVLKRLYDKKVQEKK